MIWECGITVCKTRLNLVSKIIFDYSARLCKLGFCTSLLRNLVSVFSQTASKVDKSAISFFCDSDFRGSTLCADVSQKMYIIFVA